MSTRFLFYVRAIISYLHQQQRRRRRAAPFAGLFPGLKFFRFGKKNDKNSGFFFRRRVKKTGDQKSGGIVFFLVPDFWSVFLIFGDIFRFGYDYDTPSSFEMPRMPETMECFFVCVYLKRESLTRGRNTNLRLHCLFLLRFLAGPKPKKAN